MNPLFASNLDSLRTLIPSVVRNFTFSASLLNLFSQTADTLLNRFLGEELATIICQINPASTGQDAALISAYNLARSATARIGFADHLPFAELQIADDGVTVTASADRKAAYEYQTAKLDKSLRELGWQDLDNLIKLIASKPGVFPTWTESPYFQEHQDAIFKNASDFSKYYPIQDRWLTFWALRPFIAAVEENQGLAALDRLQNLPSTVTDAQKAPLLRNLLRSLAYQAVIMGLSGLSIELNGTNVQVNYAGQYANNSYYTPPSQSLLDWVRDNLQKQADLFWQNFDDGLSLLQPAGDTDPASGLIDSEGSLIWI